MYNELQNKYVVKQVNKLRKEADTADKRVFWDYIGLAAGAVLIGVSSILAKEILPQNAEALTTGLQVLGGISSGIFGVQAVSNHNERNLKVESADHLERLSTIDRLGDSEIVQRVLKK